MKLTTQQRARFGQVLDKSATAAERIIHNSKQVEAYLQEMTDWTPEGPVKVRYNGVGQVLDIEFSAEFARDHEALKKELVRVIEVGFRRAATLRTAHTASVVEMVLPGGRNETSGA